MPVRRVSPDVQQAMGPFLCAMAERLSNGGAQRKPKIAKGARDFLPEQVTQRDVQCTTWYIVRPVRCAVR